MGVGSFKPRLKTCVDFFSCDIWWYHGKTTNKTLQGVSKNGMPIGMGILLFYKMSCKQQRKNSIGSGTLSLHYKNWHQFLGSKRFCFEFWSENKNFMNTYVNIYLKRQFQEWTNNFYMKNIDTFLSMTKFYI
jgi:hypothetical protein